MGNPSYHWLLRGIISVVRGRLTGTRGYYAFRILPECNSLKAKRNLFVRVTSLFASVAPACLCGVLRSSYAKMP